MACLVCDVPDVGQVRIVVLVIGVERGERVQEDAVKVPLHSWRPWRDVPKHVPHDAVPHTHATVKVFGGGACSEHSDQQQRHRRLYTLHSSRRASRRNPIKVHLLVVHWTGHLSSTIHRRDKLRFPTTFRAAGTEVIPDRTPGLSGDDNRVRISRLQGFDDHPFVLEHLLRLPHRIRNLITVGGFGAACRRAPVADQRSSPLLVSDTSPAATHKRRDRTVHDPGPGADVTGLPPVCRLVGVLQSCERKCDGARGKVTGS
mmetsp:Transcript_32741/g.52475  ORF Transcript_32741/g.52475 Transcript_32741/m.52475 type:complete len:259 (-) Transcript_32741:1284-2060(-)